MVVNKDESEYGKGEQEYLPFDCISGVYLGQRFELFNNEYYDIIKEIEKMQDVNLYQMQLDEKQYRLNAKLLDRSCVMYDSAIKDFLMKKPAIDLKDKNVLVTGAAGFIGSNLVLRLMHDFPDCRVIGIDNMNDYYDVSLKEYRLEKIAAVVAEGKWTFVRGDIADHETVFSLFEQYRPALVVNLAAQAGERYSIDHPDVCIQSNIFGFYNILEACRKYPVEHLVYASSSSVYGENKKVPFSVDNHVDNPVSLYAATKKSNELLAHSYSKLYNIPSTGLRFFTVYGPAGRPDMFYFNATQKLLKD